MRLSGMSQRQIAEELGLAQPTVSLMLRRVREAAIASSRDVAVQATAEQNARLDVMLGAVWDKVQTGNEKSIEVAIKVEERRAKLLGLDAVARSALDVTSDGEPVKYVVSIPVVARIDGVSHGELSSDLDIDADN